jgi:eukaryotic-like serine/threonine-protein kinase
MLCRTCGTSVSDGVPDPLCPKCSYGSALELSSSAESNGVEGYELISELGRGAMGVVWLARERVLARLVALKLIATGALPLLSQRLLREGQAAARLRHPHIVAVHALGGTGSSTFLAMDFLEGGNLDERLRGKPLAPRAAAEMIVKLADALACAHAAGIIHRDIKPSNILLDGDGEPYLADFGLATPVESAGDLTISGQIAGTPSFLAPELLQGADRASVLSDVYSLGAVLYMCLTGRPPFSGNSTAAIFAHVTDDNPIEPRLLQPEIPRDLETICLKCLEKSPAKRYVSAEAQKEDLQRFLRGEPIAARPVGRMEKISRWCVREPATATALGLATVILLILSIGLPLELIRLARARNVAETARAQAANEAATSKEVVNFLQNDLLAQASPDNQPDRDLKLRTVLERASKKIEGRFADKPFVEASIRETLASTYESLGDYATAQHHLEYAINLRRKIAGSDDPNILRAESTLAFVLATQGKYPEAEAMERNALALQHRITGGDDRDSLVSMAHLSFILYGEGKLSEAEALGLETLAAKRRVLGSEDPATVDSMHDLAMTYGDEGKFSDSEQLDLETLQIQQKIFGADNPQTLLTMNNLGNVYRHEGKYAKADGVLVQALELEKSAAGIDHPVAWYLVENLAAVRRAERRFADAESLYGQDVEIGKKLFGPEHPNTIYAMWGLACVYRDEDDLAKAELLLAQTLEMRRRVLGAGHPETLASEEGLGEVLLQLSRFAEAEPLLRESLVVRSKTAPEHWRTQNTRSLLGASLIGTRQFAEAEPLLVNAYEGMKKQEGLIPAGDHHVISDTGDRLIQLYADWGRQAEADAWKQRLASEASVAAIH